jgi:hypothetical protein
MKGKTKNKKEDKIELHDISIKPCNRDTSFDNDVMAECSIKYKGMEKSCYFKIKLADLGGWISTDQFVMLFTLAMNEIKKQIT